MIKQRMEGFQKPRSTPGTKKVGVAMIRYTDYGVTCTCGWATPTSRTIEDKIDRHLDKRHEGRGVRL